jgi:ADP-ribose pyrophosphatase YjhB (NUDIX family)
MLVPALQKVKHSLQDLGFFVEADYPYLTNGKRNEVNRVDLAAFVDDQRRDISSIAVVANFFAQSPSAKPVQRVHTYLAPIWHLVVTHDQIQWWQYKDIHQPVARTNLDTGRNQATERLPDFLYSSAAGTI